MEQVKFIWCLYIILNVLWAWLNSVITKDKERTYHGWSASIYIIICSLPTFFAPWSWIIKILFTISILLLHGSIFPVWYNEFRKVKPFNLSTTTTAIFDRIQVKLGLKTSILFNVLCLILSISLVILIKYELQT